MPAKDEFILFIEKHPELNELAKSELFISLLNALKEGSIPEDKINSSFPRVDDKDLRVMIQSLIDTGLVTRLFIAQQYMYSLTEKGHDLLKIYARARESFTIE